MRFTKPPKTYDEQVDLLISRGMKIDDRSRAIHYLSHLNYYRLAAYCLPYEQDHATHQFWPGTEFDRILEHYIFDRELRLLIIDAIERVEVSVRTQWAYHLAHTHGAHAHLDPTLFKSGKKIKWDYQKNMDSLKYTVRKSSEVFVKHFRKYDEDLPPVWVACEIMTFGQLSNWYANLKSGADRNAVAHIFDMDEVNLTSFLHHLSIVRNHCAHHSRLWNREFTFAWRLPTHRPAAVIPNFNISTGKRIYNTLVMLAYIMDIINPGHHWKLRLSELFRQHPNVKARHMGFPEGWRDLPIWQGKLTPL